MTESKQSGGLRILIPVCVVLLVPAMAAWLVNIEIALQAVDMPCKVISYILPAGVYGALTPLTADLSTITTLVPVLLLVFPLFMAVRIRRFCASDPGYLHRVVYDPYPPHFPFFLVMLGLTGTLYGLLIGLSVSGVEDLASVTPSADSVRETVDRLLGGTATALLSSLLGLVGAFLAARPLTWLFRKLAAIPEEETQRGLMDTVTTLTHDLQTLSHASREFSERLNVAAADRIDQHMARMDEAVTGLAEGLMQTNAGLRKLTELHEQTVARMEHLDSLTELRRLIEIEKHTAAAADSLYKNHGALESLRGEQEKTRSATDRLANELQRGQTSAQQSLDRIAALLDENTRDSREDRGALRKAIGHYIKNLTGKSE